MSRFKILTMTITLASLCVSCVEIIDIGVTGVPDQIVIYGQVNDSQAYDQRIRISRTTSDLSRPVSIPTAIVAVEIENGETFSYHYEEDLEHYLPDELFVGEPGTCYRLRVMLEGRTYLSTFQQMPLYTASDIVQFNFEQRTAISAGVDFEQWNMTITVDSEIPEEAPPMFIKRDLLRVYLQQEMFLPTSRFPFYSPKNCWVTDPYTGPKVRLLDGSTVTSKVVRDQYIDDLPLDDAFNSLRGFGVLQSSFSEEAFRYWQQVDQVSNREGSIFEVPPAPIPGNLTNIEDPEDRALGFFEVAKVDTVGRQITLDDIPIYMPLNGDIVDCSHVTWSQLVRVPFNCFRCLEEDLGLDRACYQCLSIPNSRVEKPTYLN